MTNKFIKKMAILSYSKDNLDVNKVKKISGKLTRRELKDYIREIKNLERKKSITIFMPKITKDKTLEKDLKKTFAGKKILIKEDKSIIAGVRIVNNDDVYDFNLKNNLDNLIAHIN